MVPLSNVVKRMPALMIPHLGLAYKFEVQSVPDDMSDDEFRQSKEDEAAAQLLTTCAYGPACPKTGASMQYGRVQVVFMDPENAGMEVLQVLQDMLLKAEAVQTAQAKLGEFPSSAPARR